MNVNLVGMNKDYKEVEDDAVFITVSNIEGWDLIVLAKT